VNGSLPVLLFDLDGTLSDNYEGISRSLRFALERLGAPAPDETTLRACVGPPLRESLARLLPSPDATAIEAALAAYRERFHDLGWRENLMYEGVPETLAALAESGARMYVCTTKPEVFATRIVAHFGLDALVTRVYGVDLAGALDDKRALLAHLLATESLDPAGAIMIGDRHLDVRAAQANGTRAVGVLWGYGSAAELEGAERLLTAPPEFVTLLD
jgi:phosphoglycolate phosphatase